MRGKSVRQKKKTTAWKMKNEKPKRQAHNVFFFFEAAKSKNVSATRAFLPPAHHDFHLCLKQRKEKRENGKLGRGVGKNKTKIKQRLRNERRKPFTTGCLRGFHTYFVVFFLFFV